MTRQPTRGGAGRGQTGNSNSGQLGETQGNSGKLLGAEAGEVPTEYTEHTEAGAERAQKKPAGKAGRGWGLGLDLSDFISVCSVCSVGHSSENCAGVAARFGGGGAQETVVRHDEGNHAVDFL